MATKTGIGGMIWKVARELATPVAFLDQISSKDRATLGVAWTAAPTTQKLKILANIVTGRITGINFFSDEVQAPQTINFGGIFNKWSGLGVGLIIVGAVVENLKINGKKILPHGSKMGQIGHRLLTGGVFGGIFDAPNDGSKPVTGTRHIQLAGSQTNTSQRTFSNTSNQMLVADSAESSLRGV